MKSILNKITVVATLVIGSLSLVSCNTMHGLGKDFQSVGSGMQKTAQGRLWSPTTTSTYQVPTTTSTVYAVPR